MDFKNICEFWSLIKTHDLFVCNIIKTMPYNGCSQMVSISLKTKKSFIAHLWCMLSVVGLEEYSARDWRAATSVQRAPVTWRKWGLWVWPPPKCIVPWWRHQMETFSALLALSAGIHLTKASDAELWYFSLLFASTNDWVNKRDAGDLRRHRARYDVTVTLNWLTIFKIC